MLFRFSLFGCMLFWFGWVCCFTLIAVRVAFLCLDFYLGVDVAVVGFVVFGLIVLLFL